MITVRKLLSLPWKTRIRKIARVLLNTEEQLHREPPKRLQRELKPIVGTVERDDALPEEIRAEAAELCRMLDREDEASPKLLRRLNGLRHALFAHLGYETADWDIREGETGRLDRNARELRNIFVYLEELRSPFNVGSIFRTAESFAVRKIFLSPECPSPEHARAQRSSMGATEVVDWSIKSFEDTLDEVAELLGIPPSAVPVAAVETGGRPLESYRFPDAGVLVLGSEELGVSGKLLETAEARSGRVTIPIAGSKASLNVGVAFAIVVHAWYTRSVSRRL